MAQLDLNGRLRLHNARFAQMWGLPAPLLVPGSEDAMAEHLAARVADPERLLGMLHATREWPEMETLQVFELLDGRRFERCTEPQREQGRCIGVWVRWRDLTPQPAPAPRAGGARHLVLYIDDNAVNRVLMEVLLEGQAGLELRLANSGSEGLQMARAEPPALVLLDIRLPDLSGFEVLQALRADPLLRAVPCLAVSAAAMPDEIAAARAAGFDAYLTKPLDVAALLAEIKGRLGA